MSLTPHYNNSLILETTGLFEKHLEEIFVTAQTCAAFRDAVILLKTWLHQRKLDEVRGGRSVSEGVRVTGDLCEWCVRCRL